MRHTTRQYLSTLDTETLLTIIEGLCGFGGFDVNHGPDPSDGKPIVYGSHHLHGTFTLANVDEKPVPKYAEPGTARFVCNNLWKPEKNTAIMSLQFDTEDNLPPDVQAQELVNNINDTTYFRVSLESVIPVNPDWARIIDSQGCSSMELEEDKYACGCMQDPPCKGCRLSSQPIKQDVNRLHLFAIYTIGEDLSSSPTVYVMARHDQEAVSIFHKSHSKEHENQACELVVTLVQHCELGDE
jgi:hypothetical protein